MRERGLQKRKSTRRFDGKMLYTLNFLQKTRIFFKREGLDETKKKLCTEFFKKNKYGVANTFKSEDVVFCERSTKYEANKAPSNGLSDLSSFDRHFPQYLKLSMSEY